MAQPLQAILLGTTHENYRVWLASYHMMGARPTVVYSAAARRGDSIMVAFSGALPSALRPLIRNNALGELTRLRFKGTMAEYQHNFLALLCCTDRLTLRQPTQKIWPP